MGASRKAEREEARRFFRSTYLDNAWGGKRSRSGPGSEGRAGRQKQRIVKRIVKRHGVRRVLDIGCGDLHWMLPMLGRFETYVGLEFVEELVAADTRLLAGRGLPGARVQLIDGADRESWSRVEGSFDLVLCLDVLGHLLRPEVDALLELLFERQLAELVLVTNRRDATSGRYLEEAKSRDEGIDIELHPRFQASGFTRIESTSARFPGDWFDLYRAAGGSAD